MNNIEQRLEYLETSYEILRMQNRVLTTAFKSLVSSLPADMAQDTSEAIMLAFENMLAELDYENSPHTDLLHETINSFFYDKENSFPL